MTTVEVFKEKKRGKLIVFEGIDRSGKSTMSRALKGQLGDGAVWMNFPNRTNKTGALINQFLSKDAKEKEMDARGMALLFVANRWEDVSVIEKHLNEGKHVILDRYIDSGIAYGVAQGLDLEWCQRINEGLPKADMVVYIKISAQVASSRAGFGEEKYERTDLLERVADYFNEKSYQATTDCPWLTFNGTLPIELLRDMIDIMVMKEIEKQKG